MAELMPAAQTTGGDNYRCTRGNCGDVVGHPENQDAHNAAKHAGGGGGTKYQVGETANGGNTQL